VFIYNPLAKESAVYQAWRDLGNAPGRTNWPDARVVERYVAHLADASAGGNSRASVSALVPESRPIVRDLRALLGVTALDSPFGELLSESGIEVHFPVLDQFDARSIEIGDRRPAVFISSRVLDGIDFFANFVGTWSRLNSYLGERALLPAGSPVPYAWIPFLVNDGYIDLGELPGGYADYHNNFMESFLRGMIMIVHSPRFKAGGSLEAGRVQVAESRDNFIEPQYLAALTLLYVYLHECAHIFLAHNERVPRLAPVDQLIGGIIEEWIDEKNRAAGEIVAQPLWGKGSSLQFSFEATADIQAVRSTIGGYGDAVLEAASLWFTALSTCRVGGADLFDALKRSTGDEYPPYPMRVWALNGALSSYRRQGHVAHSVRRAAELMAGAAVPYKPEQHRTRGTATHRFGWRLPKARRS